MAYDDANYYHANDDYNEEDVDSWNESEYGINTYFVVFLSLLALVLVLAKFLHDAPAMSKIVPEAGMTIIVGVIAGGIIYSTTLSADENNNDDAGENDNDDGENENIGIFVAEGLLSFSPTIFFFVLLPPIIFNSGYNIKRDVFLRHFTPISLFACVGTAISTIVVAFTLWAAKLTGLTGDFKPRLTELMAFGALISATDPVSTLAVFQAKQVDPQLFYLVFGESVLNDAVGLVLFKTLSKFVGKEEKFGTFLLAAIEFLGDFFVSFFGSMAVGVLAGVISAFFFKKVDMRHTPLLELSLFLLNMYLPFFFAELMELSGIVTILFTGISAKRYATQNLSKLTEGNVDALFRVTAHLAETSIFLELGLSVFGLLGNANYEWKFVVWAIFACLLGRALNIYPLRTFYNRLLCAKSIDDLNCSNPMPRSPMQSQGMDDNETTVTDASYPTSPVSPVNVCVNSMLAEPLGTQLSGISEQHHGTIERLPSLTPKRHKDLKIRDNTAHMLWFSGLRGAVAYACAKTFPNAFGNRTSFVFVTMAIVLFTVFVFGCTTDLALSRLKIEINVDEDTYMKDNNTTKKMHFINRFENRFIRPFITRPRNESTPKHGGIELGSVKSDEKDSWSIGSSETMHTTNTGTNSSSRFQHFRQTDDDAESKQCNSIYDFGLGADYGVNSRSSLELSQSSLRTDNSMSALI